LGLFVAARPNPRVLVVHNRYRVVGGEERSAELQLRALERAGIEHALFERRSAEAGRGAAAASMLRGGSDTQAVAAAARDLGADVVHVHNMLPLIGPRGLSAAKSTGAKVVLHLHNVRLFCATGFGERDGAPCERCRGRNTFPGLRLNCRRSLPEAAVYAAGLAAHQPRVLRAVDRFVAPGSAAANLLARRGLPRERIQPLAHYLPADSFADGSRAGDGAYALVASRLSPEKGIDMAIEAAAAAGVPLRVAGDGPDRARLEALAAGADVEFLGRVPSDGVRELLAGAGALLMASRYHEFSPYSALEAMAQGVPVVATAMGGMPELVGSGRCTPPADAAAFAARVAGLWADERARQAEGEELLARARERHGEERYMRELLDLYGAL
jgi:glycosyltransferase involved in cell wall biosynthesis